MEDFEKADLGQELLTALREMVEHFATRPEFRTAESYGKTNAQVAADARALLARFADPAAPPFPAAGVKPQDYVCNNAICQLTGFHTPECKAGNQKFEKAERAFAGLKNVNRDAMAQTTVEDLVFAAETELDLYMEGESKMTERQAAQIRMFIERYKHPSSAAPRGAATGVKEQD